jgi:predicted nucleic-acid-binding protein
MTGIDTNVLVRYITQDDPQQAEAASQFIEKSCTPEQPGYVNHIVLCEVVWVLQRCYKTRPEETLKVIEQILRTEQLHVQEPPVVWLALSAARAGKADFADYLNVSINKKAGCEQTVTFDRAFQGTDGVFVLTNG